MIHRLLALIEQCEGFTVDVDRHTCVDFQRGYAVSLSVGPRLSLHPSRLNDITLMHYLDLARDCHMPFIGGWLDREHNLYLLEPVSIQLSLADAMEMAHHHDQRFVYGFREGLDIRVPRLRESRETSV